MTSQFSWFLWSTFEIGSCLLHWILTPVWTWMQLGIPQQRMLVIQRSKLKTGGVRASWVWDNQAGLLSLPLNLSLKFPFSYQLYDEYGSLPFFLVLSIFWWIIPHFSYYHTNSTLINYVSEFFLVLCLFKALYNNWPLMSFQTHTFAISSVVQHLECKWTENEYSQ